MKIKQNNRFQYKKIILLTSVLVVCFILGYLLFSFYNSHWPFTKSSNLTTPTTVTPVDNSKTTAVKGADSPTNSDNTTDQIPASKESVATITQLQQTGNEVMFTANITNTKEAGKCTLTFTNPNDKPVTREFDATTKGDSAACGPVNIPATDFSYIGQWKATLRYYTSTTQTIAEGSVTVS